MAVGSRSPPPGFVLAAMSLARHYEAKRNDIEVRRHQRSRPGREPTPICLRYDSEAWPLSRHRDGRRRFDQASAMARSRLPAHRDPNTLPVERPRHRHRAGMHRHFQRQGKGLAHSDRRAKRVLGLRRAFRPAPTWTIVFGVNHDKADERSSGGFKWLLHHELPGAGGKSAERHRRHRDRFHDHDSRPIPATSRRWTRCTTTSIAAVPRQCR